MGADPTKSVLPALDVNVTVVSGLQPVPVTVTVVPVGPEERESTSVPGVACTLGVEIKKIETNNAEVSKRTRYKELTGRVLNFRHAKTISRVHTI